MPPADLKPLTSLRFFAALWVVLYAYWQNLAGVVAPLLVQRGFLGVEVFFVLSGFILCHVYLPAWQEGRFRYGPFLWARLARVYPLHLATLAGVGILAGGALSLGMSIDSRVLSWDVLPANILMMHAWGVTRVVGWNHPSWSISAEWFAYLSFPVFALTTMRLRRRPLVALAGALILLFAGYPAFERLAGFPLTQATNQWGALRIVPCFAYGCALYLVWRGNLVRGRFAAIAGAIGSVLTLVLSAAMNGPDAVVVAAGGGLILFLATLAQTGSRLGGQRWLVYLGEVSYALYLVAIPWQLLFVNAATRMLHLPHKQLPILLWLAYLAGAILLAMGAHHLIERPAREGVRLWGREVFRTRPLAACG